MNLLIPSVRILHWIERSKDPARWILLFCTVHTVLYNYIMYGTYCTVHTVLFFTYCTVLFILYCNVMFRINHFKDPLSLSERTFSTFEFYSEYEDRLTPAGLSFFQGPDFKQIQPNKNTKHDKHRNTSLRPKNLRKKHLGRSVLC